MYCPNTSNKLHLNEKHTEAGSDVEARWFRRINDPGPLAPGGPEWRHKNCLQESNNPTSFTYSISVSAVYTYIVENCTFNKRMRGSDLRTHGPDMP